MISLIVSFYKRTDFLELVLQAVARQSYRDFEVVVSEDNNAAETLLFLDEARRRYSYPIKHVSQEDVGFRKTKILNAAVLAAAGEQLVFLDGDCIPHRHFLKEYAKAIRDKKICYGRRAYLSQTITTRLLQERSIKNLRFFKLLFAGATSMGAAMYLPFKRNIDKQYRDILGCNWGILRRHVLEVNGFDEDYVRAGAGEDCDIDWRLTSVGLRKKSMKNRAIVYHLYHAENYSNDDTLFVHALKREKMKAGNAYCRNGIRKG
jgi:cellulose synthase/poly-beta-1,6-N-acetylglucosamine synthase-like glycosyltransferase